MVSRATPMATASIPPIISDNPSLPPPGFPQPPPPPPPGFQQPSSSSGFQHPPPPPYPHNASTSGLPPPSFNYYQPPPPTFDQIFPVNIPTPIKLTPTNYLTWKAQILPITIGYNLMRFLTSPPPNPTVQTTDGQVQFNQEYLPWNRQDQLVLGWLRASLSESIQAHYVSCTSSASLWTAIHQQFATNSRSRLLDLKRQLQSAKKGSSSCTDFVLRIRQLADELASIGAPPSEDDLLLVVTNGLGSEYNAFVAAITTTSRHEALSLQDLHGMLLSHEALINSQNDSSASLPSAFYSNPPRNNSSGYTPNWKGKNNGANGKGNTSQQIKGPVFNLPKPINQSSQSGPTIFNSQPNNTTSQAVQSALCQICKKPNHSAKFCRFRYAPDPLYQQRMANNNGSSNFQAFVAQPSSTPNSTEWILDSGASHHVTNDINNMSSFFNYTGSDNLHIGDGSGLSIDHIGTSTITLSNVSLFLKNVLHVSTFSRNLISLSKLLLDNPSLTIVFTNSICMLKDHHTKTILLEIPCNNGLYHFRIPSSTSPPQAMFGIRTTASMWHDRFGHPSNSVTMKLLKDFALPCTSLSLETCNDCMIAKSHKLSFSSSSSCTTSPLELVHSDVWGPSPIVSKNNFRYYLIFVDDFSRFTWIFFMSNKSEVLSIFTRFKAQVENLLNCTIKTLRTDGGTEYKPIAKHFPQLVHQTTCPYTPEQNGISERKHRHVVELSLAIMSRASIPKCFWDEIFSSVVYLINRLPNANSTIPYTVLYNKSPDYSLLRVLGCLCYPYTRPYTSNKLEPRSLPCVFLGYATLQKGYRCFDLQTNRMYISRHVRFDEMKFPFRTVSPNLSPSCSSSEASSDHIPLLLFQHNSQVHQAANDRPIQHSPAQIFQPTTGPTDHTHRAQQASANLPQSSRDDVDSDPASANPIQHSRDSDPASATPSISRVALTQPLPPTNTSVSAATNTPVSAATNNPVQSVLHQSTSSSPTQTTIPTNTTINQHPMITRNKDKTRKPRYFPNHVAYLTNLEQEPTTFAKANPIPQWREAMTSEINALALNNTWTLVPPPPDCRIIGCKWVYKIKRRSDGTIERYKARLVAKGYHQQEGIDYFDTFSPVVRPTTIRIILSIAISQQWVIRQLDVNNAFLHGDLTEQVYMDQPPDFIDSSHPRHVCLLSKSLYGLKQSPRAWFHKLSSTLLDLGFVESQYDPSLFISTNSKHFTIILVYVDDILVTGSNPSFISEFTSILHSKFSLKDLGSINYFLGIEISTLPKGLHLSQSKYIHDILVRAKMLNAKPASSPMATTPTLSRNDSEVFDDPQLYRSIIGALQYATLTRPDISFAVNRVSQFMHQPTINHWAAVKRILRYLCGSLTHGLSFYNNSNLQIHAYCDADWAGCPDDRRSTTGFAIFLGGNLVSWSAKKQPTVSRSSTEAEYRSLAITCAELLWVQYLLHELHIPLPSPPTLWCDNIGATFLASNPMFHARTKHIEIDYHFVRERIMSKELLVRFLSSHDQIADVLTKPLSTARFLNLRSKLTVTDAPSACGGSVSIKELDDTAPTQ
ncbi:hypothetical protein LUZ61_020926 [Rhynchospora tenuis]|uniref:Integrase catalytic domain-containing protein n=1 Tax=Rhynchospora tenuis TaxID=198213 RepID=A0AAD5ZDX6_9POAL|nr:hypothetical protein LUZ61_020926 [Rhynchospora tenuis]